MDADKTAQKRVRVNEGAKHFWHENLLSFIEES